MPPVKLKLPPLLPPPPPRKELIVRDPVEVRTDPAQGKGPVVVAFSALVAWLASHSHFVVSIALHLALLAVFGIMVMTERSASPTVGIEAFLGKENAQAIDLGNVGDHPALKLDEPKPRDPLPFAGGDIEFPVAAVGAGPLTAGPGEASEGDDDPGGDIEISVGFFGTAAEGNSFVYIVDASGSMDEGGRWGRAISELGRSIAKLKPHQQFYIYFFSDAGKEFRLFDPRPARGLVPATPGNKTKAQRWIRHRAIRPGGLTNPETSIEEGLALKPDVIFLMTDGEFDDPELLVARIARLNQGQTVIHTIALDNQSGEECLQDIARQNRGTYRFVKR